MSIKITFFVTCLMVLGNFANADYKIHDAINDAKLNNQELQVIDKDFLVKKLSKYKVAAGFWPVAGISATQTNGESALHNTRTYNDTDNFDNSIYIQQELFAGGKTIAQMKAADSAVSAAELELNAKIAQVFLKVIDAYHEVILARSIYKISLNNKKAMNNRLEQIKTRFKAGEVTKTEVSWAKYKLANAITEVEKSFGDMKTAEANFGYIIGKNPGNDLVIIPVNKVNTPKDFSTFASAVRQANLNIKIAKEQLNIQKTGVTIAAADLMPNVIAKMSYSDSESSRIKGKTYAISVSVPIFNGNTYIGIKEARYKARSAEASLNDAIGSIEQNIVQVWNKYQVAISQTKSVKEALTAAQDALAGVQQEYEVGTKTTLDLLESEQQLFNAQISQEKVNKALIMSAFQMKALMGELHKFNFQDL